MAAGPRGRGRGRLLLAALVALATLAASPQRALSGPSRAPPPLPRPIVFMHVRVRAHRPAARGEAGRVPPSTLSPYRPGPCVRAHTFLLHTRHLYISALLQRPGPRNALSHCPSPLSPPAARLPRRARPGPATEQKTGGTSIMAHLKKEQRLGCPSFRRSAHGQAAQEGARGPGCAGTPLERICSWKKKGSVMNVLSKKGAGEAETSHNMLRYSEWAFARAWAARRAGCTFSELHHFDYRSVAAFEALGHDAMVQLREPLDLIESAYNYQRKENKKRGMGAALRGGPAEWYGSIGRRMPLSEASLLGLFDHLPMGDLRTHLPLALKRNASASLLALEERRLLEPEVTAATARCLGANPCAAPCVVGKGLASNASHMKSKWCEPAPGGMAGLRFETLAGSAEGNAKVAAFGRYAQRVRALDAALEPCLASKATAYACMQSPEDRTLPPREVLEHLDAAIAERLRSFRYVGVTEDMPAFLDDLCSRAGLCVRASSRSRRANVGTKTWPLRAAQREELARHPLMSLGLRAHRLAASLACERVPAGGRAQSAACGIARPAR